MPNPIRTALFSRQQHGGVFSIQDMQDHPGNIWFVDSGCASGGDTAGHGRNPDQAFLTLDYAVGRCSTNNGDVIYLMPGHAETIIADSGVDIDVAGLKVIGLGWGRSRPLFTFQTAVTADFKLAAANTWVENIVFSANIDATTGIIEVTGTDCRLKNIEVVDTTGQMTDGITVVNNADRLVIEGLRYIGANAAGTNAAIAVDGCDDLIIRDFDIYGDFAVGAIDFRTTASNRVRIYGIGGNPSYIWTENAADICIVDTITGSTGFIGPNLNLMLQDNAANITTAVTGATFQLMDPVYVCNLVNEKGMLINWVASTHA